MAQAHPKKPKCAAIANNGKPCSTTVWGESQFCFFHDPATEGLRAKGRSRGGKAHQGRIYRPSKKNYLLVSARSVVNALSEVFYDVRAGTLTWRQGTALASIGSTILTGLKMCSEAKLEKGDEKKATEEAVLVIRQLYGLPVKADGGNGESKTPIASGGNGTSN